MASKDFLARGFNCIEYSNGSRHNIADYCDMAIRTSNKRANLMGEGEMRKKLGISLVYISKHTTSCDKCGPWQGRVYIDDVWSGGKAEDGEYPLLSTAIAGGLFHPRCRHGSSTYFEDINEEPEEVTNAKHNYDEDDRYTQYLQQRKKQYERLAAGSLLPENVEMYQNKANELQNQINGVKINQDNTNGDKELNYIDITDRYNTDNSYQIKKQKYFIDDNGTRYTVDGKHVKLEPSEREIEVANLMGLIFGGKVNIIPRISYPQGIKTPDYIINNERFDLKTLKENNKNTIYNALHKQKLQADNFIIDISINGMTQVEAENQIKNIYKSRHTEWIKRIILIKDDKILKIFIRK